MTAAPWRNGAPGALGEAGADAAGRRIERHSDHTEKALAPYRLEDALEAVVRLAQHCVPGCDTATATICWADVAAVASTDGLPAAGDLPLPADHPAWEVLRSGEPAFVDASSAGERRWPLGATNALFAPVFGSVACELVGTINLYAGADRLGPDAVEPARLLARQAEAVVAAHCWIREHEHRAAGLQTALEGRDVIGQAKGILMAGGGIDAERAFTMLVRASQRENRKLRDVALDLVQRTATRTMPST